MNKEIKTKSLVEAALLSALVIIMSLFGMYLPVIGTIISLASPVPIVILGLRHGIKWSVLSVLVVGLSLTLLISPLQSLAVSLGFGFLGVALGETVRRKLSLSRIMVWGTLASLISKLLLLLAVMLFLGTNSLTDNMDMLHKMMEQSIQLYSGLGMSAGQIELLQKTMEEMLRLLKIIFPVLLLLVSVLDTFFNYFICRYVLKRLDYALPAFLPFACWNIPKSLTVVLLAGLVLIVAGNHYNLALLANIGLNMQYFSMLLFLLQGFAVTVYFLKKWRVTKPLRVVILILLFITPLFTEIIVWLGLLDVFFDYRRLKQSKGGSDV